MSEAHVVLAGYYPPPFAGEPIHVKQLAEMLRERAVRVDVINLNREAPSSPDYRTARGRVAGVRLLTELVQPGSVFHLHTNGHNRKSWLLIVAAGVIARWKGARSILTIHSGLFPAFVRRFGRARRWMAGWALGRYGRLVGVNTEIARGFAHLGVPERTVSVIPAFLGVPSPPALRGVDRDAIGGFRPLLVAVGGGDQDPERGLPVVLQTLTRLTSAWPAVGVVLIGWKVGPKVEPLIRELGLDRHAVCLGQVTHERCLSLMGAADVVVRSTFADGDAITVREALALGVPVVASDTDFRPEGVTLFRKGDGDDLLAKLRSVLSAPAPSRERSADDGDSARSLWGVYQDMLEAIRASHLVPTTIAASHKGVPRP